MNLKIIFICYKLIINFFKNIKIILYNYHYINFKYKYIDD